MLGMTIMAVAILAVAFFPSLPSFPHLVTLLILAAILMFGSRYGGLLARPVRYLALALVGVVIGAASGWHLLNQQLPAEIEGEDLWYDGYVSALPEQRSNLVRFEFTASSDQQPQKLLISWYGTHELKVGERWRFQLRLRRPRGSVNEGGLDYQRWLLSQGFGATGYVRKAERLAGEQWLLFPRWRQTIKTWLNESLPAEREAVRGPLLALAIGDRSAMSQEQWSLLQTTGTNHLMAISGLHVGVVALLGWWLGWLLRGLWSLLGSLLDSRRLWFYALPALMSCLSATLYAGLAGFALPTQRALVMVLVVHAYALFFRRLAVGHTLAAALLAVALVDPLAAHDMGFWLSFGAVAILLWVFANRHSLATGWRSKGLALARAQAVLLVGLFIPLLCFGLPVSLLAPVANFFAVPVISFAVIIPLVMALLLLVPAPPVATLLLGLAAFNLSWAMQLLASLQSYVGELTWYPNGALPSAFLLLLGVVAVALLVLPLGRIRWLAAILLLPIVFPANTANKPPLQLTVLDVGQGLALLVETPEGNLLYDTGPGFSDRFNAGSGIVAPYLRHAGIGEIDVLVVSHGDNDHAGGVAALLPLVPVKQGYGGEDVGGVNFTNCHIAKPWHWGEVHFQFLQPEASTLTRNSNNRSCILLVSWRDQKLLLPGDIENVVEQALLRENWLPEYSTVVVAPHHGSNTSSGSAFVSALRPEWVIYSAGYRSRYGHPHPKVQARYQAVASRALNTAYCGQIQLRWNERGDVEERLLRLKQPRYWLDTERCEPENPPTLAEWLDS